MQRLTPEQAAARAFALFGAMTGASVEAMRARRRGATVDTARNLALHFLVEIEGYGIVALGRALGRHYSSVKNNHLRGWVLRDLAKQEIGDALFEWTKAHWREPLSKLRPGLSRRRKAFWRTLNDAREQCGSLKLADEDLAAAIAAMARASSLRVKAEPKSKRARAAVPLIDEPPAVAMLRLAPSIQRLAPAISYEPAPGGGHFIRIISDVRQKASEALAIAARMLLAEAGFPGEQRGLSHTERGWMAGLKIAPALAALLAVIHTDSRAPILPSIDGALAPAQSPTLAIA